MTQALVTEQVEVTEATTTFAPTDIDTSTGRLLIGIISPGQGSSGYYSQECVEAAGTDGIFPKGTLMFADHPTEQEQYDRPVRSVRDVVAVLTEDGYWDADRATLVAEAEVFAPYRELFTDKTFASAIGVSIRAAAEVAEGKHGREITRIVHAESVDFVTKAGRGGSILQVLESAPARVNGRAVRRGISEATVNDRREALANLLRDEYGADKTYVWLRDFDDTTAWFDVEAPDDAGTYQQAYTSTDDVPTGLEGDRTEVRPKTTYVPVTDPTVSATESSQSDPAGQQHPITNESVGGHMATTQIEESALATLQEAAGRVPALEAERDEARTELAEARRENAVLRAGTVAEARARSRVAEANADLSPLVVDRIVREALTEVPLTSENRLDEAAFDTRVDNARTAEEGYLATLAEQAGVGTVSAFGITKATAPDESELRQANESKRASMFGRQIKEGA